MSDRSARQPTELLRSSRLARAAPPARPAAAECQEIPLLRFLRLSCVHHSHLAIHHLPHSFKSSLLVIYDMAKDSFGRKAHRDGSQGSSDSGKFQDDRTVPWHEGGQERHAFNRRKFAKLGGSAGTRCACHAAERS